MVSAHMVRDRRGMGWLGWLMVLVIVTAAFWGTYYAFFAPRLPAAPYVPPIAENGDFAEVDYRGWFPDTQRTFDTSIESVAKDNASFRKAASFQYRTGTGAYTPLGFVMGCEATAGCPLPAFQDAVRGMRVGESRVFLLPPEKAYGLADPDKVLVRPLLEDVPATETLNDTEFQQRFGGRAADGTVVRDWVWGWNVTVRVSGDLITIRHSPVLREIVTVAGKWSAEILSIDDAANGGEGTIRVRHLLAQADVNAFVAADREGNFIVVALDPSGGTFTVDYNQEVVGKTLAFEITLRSVRKGNP
jgi:FKBP-type peptidyl-prolyl cis-trans isomerase 2